MRQHARKLLAPAFVTVVGLAVLAGAEPARPKPHSLTIEGLADGKLLVRQTSADGKTLDLKIERQGDGRFHFVLEGGRIACDQFRIGESGRIGVFGNVVMRSNQGSFTRADGLAIIPSRSGTEGIVVEGLPESKIPRAKP